MNLYQDGLDACLKRAFFRLTSEKKGTMEVSIDDMGLLRVRPLSRKYITPVPQSCIIGYYDQRIDFSVLRDDMIGHADSLGRRWRFGPRKTKLAGI